MKRSKARRDAERHEHERRAAEQTAASVACTRIQDSGRNSRLALMAHQQWRLAWLAWADAFDALQDLIAEENAKAAKSAVREGS